MLLAQQMRLLALAVAAAALQAPPKTHRATHLAASPQHTGAPPTLRDALPHWLTSPPTPAPRARRPAPSAAAAGRCITYTLPPGLRPGDRHYIAAGSGAKVLFTVPQSCQPGTRLRVSDTATKPLAPITGHHLPLALSPRKRLACSRAHGLCV